VHGRMSSCDAHALTNGDYCGQHFLPIIHSHSFTCERMSANGRRVQCPFADFNPLLIFSSFKVIFQIRCTPLCKNKKLQLMPLKK
jgi:hypothetical protein